MDESRIEGHLEEIAEAGYTIVEDAIEPALVAELLAAIHEVEERQATRPKGNVLEGYKTLRNYNLLAKSPAFQKMPVHENVLPLVERLLGPSCLLSGMTSMDLGPGEVAQPLHPDDAVIGIPRPHLPLVCTTIWALTDFSDENGGTRLVPGSHRFDHGPDYTRSYESIPAVMPAGSVLVFDGSLWHGSGANRTEDSWRVGVNVQYCTGFLRTQQNQYLGIPHDIVRGFSDRLLELCGYGLHLGVMGHVDGESPASVLGEQRLAETAYAALGALAPPGEEGDAPRS